MKANFLITTIGRRVTLTRFFKQELNKINGKLIVTDNSPLAPALYFADAFYLTPKVDDPVYIDRLLEICRREEVNIIIPLLEKAFPILNKARDKFEKEGIILLLSSNNVISTCKDKYLLYKYFTKKNVPTPRTYLPETLNKQVDFPLFIKPRYGQGSQSTFKVSNKNELNFFVDYVEDPIIQEFISGDEYTIDTLSDLEANCLVAVPRKRIEVRAGEVSKAVTVKDHRLIELAKSIVEDLGIIGPANLQAKITPEGDIFLIEINPRFGGGVPLSYWAGVNYPLLIAKLIQGEKIKPFVDKFKEGLVMLRYDTSLLKNISELEEYGD